MGISCKEESGGEGQWLSLDNLGKSIQNKDGYKTICKKCRSITEKSYYQHQDQKMTPEELKESKDNRKFKTQNKTNRR